MNSNFNSEIFYSDLPLTPGMLQKLSSEFIPKSAGEGI